MALKIRLRQQGCNNHSVYRMVVIDSRCRRDGPYVECVGFYDPTANREELRLNLKKERIQHWLNLGAVLSEQASHLVAHSHPEVIKEQTEKALKKKAKRTAEKREKRRAKAKAAA